VPTLPVATMTSSCILRSYCSKSISLNSQLLTIAFQLRSCSGVVLPNVQIWSRHAAGEAGQQ
jgi:hypothetical protein